MDRDDDERKHSTISESEKEQRWDKIFDKTYTREDIRNQYDNWIEQDSRMETIFNECRKPILDLGCGIGIDTLHLLEKGHNVVACDFSSKALDIVKKNIPEAITRQFNMTKGIPIANEEFALIIGNKSIHYFSEQETRNLISEIHRVLKIGGHFAFVVNSIKDTSYGAGNGVKLEENFYETRGTTKRFFDEEELRRFFDSEHWEFISANEIEVEVQGERMQTVTLKVDGQEAPTKKVTWNCMVKKK